MSKSICDTSENIETLLWEQASLTDSHPMGPCRPGKMVKVIVIFFLKFFIKTMLFIDTVLEEHQ